MRFASLAVVLLAGGVACSSGSAMGPTQEGGAPDRSPDAGGPQEHVPAADSHGTGGPQMSDDPPGYEAWWYPECVTPEGSCPDDKCFRSGGTVVGDRCAPYRALEFGCVPRTTLVAGWQCWMRESNAELIFTLVAPKGGDFVPCQGGFPPAQGSLCVDGGAD